MNSLISDLKKELSQVKDKVNKLEAKNSNFELRVKNGKRNQQACFRG